MRGLLVTAALLVAVAPAAATASVAGAFRVILAKPPALACGRLVIRAVGSRGSLVTIRFGPPECNPPGDLNR